MLFLFVGIAARCAIVVAVAFILSRTVPRNMVYRFVFLFVLWVPLNFVINYVDVSFLGYHKMGWTGVFIIALRFPSGSFAAFSARTPYWRFPVRISCAKFCNAF
jgi:hypothetical protein